MELEKQTRILGPRWSMKEMAEKGLCCLSVSISHHLSLSLSICLSVSLSHTHTTLMEAELEAWNGRRRTEIVSISN